MTSLEALFSDLNPPVDFFSLRHVRTRSETVEVRNDVLEPLSDALDVGVMLTVIHGGGLGYAATPDVSAAGLRGALARATEWAARSAGRAVMDFSSLEAPLPRGEYRTPVKRPWDSVPLADRIDLLKRQCAALNAGDRIVDRTASLWNTHTTTHYFDSRGGRYVQEQNLLVPYLEVVANQGTETQTRSFAGRGHCRQGGMEILDDIAFEAGAPVLAQEVLELLAAEQCPTGTLELVLAPDQMMLQIHESIGHPLELDRILGDERNYAGTSFVTIDMFGTYQYGSKLLNVTFDPTRGEQLASYGFDDEGLPATREYIIEAGLLVRGLGAHTSQVRSGLPGVANSRANGWNRPPIDRMANLNVEPGDLSFDDLIGSIERGVFMSSNCSWSIDDSRNKFQFGCEYARLIEDGELGAVVRNPNYRGISATFWRSLSGVGDASTFQVLGTPYCGKGEPNQVIMVGHASPVCRFTDVSVFGGAT
jgi:predicted Zn-dependent protease